jgi:hypothetical protein
MHATDHVRTVRADRVGATGFIEILARMAPLLKKIVTKPAVSPAFMRADGAARPAPRRI